MNPEFPKYLADRIPVTPRWLCDGDRILVVHTEGQSDEAVDLPIVALTENRDDNGPTVVTVTYRGSDGGTAVREFTDPNQWLSVAFPRSTAPVGAAA